MKLPSILFSFLLFLIPPALATPHLFEAIELYEKGKYTEAAAHFQHLYGPLAQIYKDDLVAKNKLAPEHAMQDNFESEPWYKLATGYFYVSQRAQDYIQRGLQWKIKERLGRGAPQAKRHYDALGDEILQKNVPATSRLTVLVAENKATKQNIRKCLTTGIMNSSLDFIDIRNLLMLRDYTEDGLCIDVNGFNFHDLVPELTALLKDFDVGDALYELYRRSQTEGDTAPNFPSPVVLRTAAFYGSTSALREVFQSKSYSEDEVSFWLTHLVRNPDVESTLVSILADLYWKGDMGRPRDQKLAKAYCHEALRRNKRDEDPIVYRDCYVRLRQLTPRDTGVISYACKAAKLYLESTDIADLKYMCHIARSLLDEGTDQQVKLGFRLLEHVYKLSPTEPDVLRDIIVSCYNNEFLDLTPYIDAAMSLAEQDTIVLYALAYIHHRLSLTTTVDQPIGERLFTLLGTIDTDDRPDVAYLRGVFAEMHSLKDTDPASFFERSHIHGCPQGSIRYICSLPNGAEAEGLNRNFIEDLGDTNPELTAQAQNQLGLILKDRTYDTPEKRAAADQEAIELFTIASEFPSLTAAASFNLGLMHQSGRAGEGCSAETSLPFFAKGLLDPEISDDAQYEIARSYILLEQIDKAIPVLEFLLERKHPRALIVRANLLIHQATASKDKDESIELLQRASELFKTAAIRTPEVQAYRAYLYACGLKNANNDVIFEPRLDQALKIVKKLTQQNNSVALLFVSNFFQKGISSLEEPPAAEDIQSAESITEPNADVNRLATRVEGLLRELEGRTVKTKKALSVLNQSVMQLGGSVKSNRSGSRFHVTLGTAEQTFHKPHGGKGNEFSGGSLSAIRDFLLTASARAGAASEDEAKAEVEAQTTTTKADSAQSCRDE